MSEIQAQIRVRPHPLDNGFVCVECQSWSRRWQ
jgi:hypothetical protein